ncbi:hypothetical protein IP69_01680 [Bosea sp. AAP35]|uniref:hypothetical protein n=1 Tax=Bosea sp. AAP35 TaxID=1523417 RepID=UPI0006B98330|nr:hypothetical protein [Bosea sp. AAP35]KPF72628.1 hypothetical protein IP69_01680 [Bosea sp. AAP35]
MTAFDVLAKALKATALVVLLSFAWAMPANAHAGHGAAVKAVAPAAAILPQDAHQALATASLAADSAGLCDWSATSAPAPTGCPQGENAPERTCCGTMCIVVLMEHGIASLPLRTPHRIRLNVPPETPSLVRAPHLPSRPPRTTNIA